jgi:hypothetical protein
LRQRSFWDSFGTVALVLAQTCAKILGNFSRGVAQPGSAPALGEDDPLLSFLSVQRFPKVFNNSGYLLSLETDPESGQHDRVLGQFRDSRG